MTPSSLQTGIVGVPNAMTKGTNGAKETLSIHGHATNMRLAHEETTCAAFPAELHIVADSRTSLPTSSMR